MAVTFAGIATLAAVGGAWAVRVNQYGRVFALLCLSAFAATLLSRRLADWLTRPLVAAGDRLLRTASGGTADLGPVHAALLGVATGLLWAPCAGPILGLVLTGAAISGPSTHTTLLLFAYAAGAATSLAVALLAGGRVFAALKKSLGAGEWIRRALGAGVLLAVLAIAFGWDSNVLTRWSLAGTNRLEQSLINGIDPAASPQSSAMAMSDSTSGGRMMMQAGKRTEGLPNEGDMPALDGATGWLNSPPLTPQALHGKVVLVDFWTYSCINCLRALLLRPGMVRNTKTMGWWSSAFTRRNLPSRKISPTCAGPSPACISTIRWPWMTTSRFGRASTISSGQRTISSMRRAVFAATSARVTTRNPNSSSVGLLIDAGQADLPPAGIDAAGVTGAQAAPDEAHDQSPETYIGYRRADGLSSSGGSGRIALTTTLRFSDTLALNQWALAGNWSVDPEKAVLRVTPRENRLSLLCARSAPWLSVWKR